MVFFSKYQVAAGCLLVGTVWKREMFIRRLLCHVEVDRFPPFALSLVLRTLPTAAQPPVLILTCLPPSGHLTIWKHSQCPKDNVIKQWWTHKLGVYKKMLSEVSQVYVKHYMISPSGTWSTKQTSERNINRDMAIKNKLTVTRAEREGG